MAEVSEPDKLTVYRVNVIESKLDVVLAEAREFRIEQREMFANHDMRIDRIEQTEPAEQAKAVADFKTTIRNLKIAIAALAAGVATSGAKLMHIFGG